MIDDADFFVSSLCVLFVEFGENPDDRFRCRSYHTARSSRVNEPLIVTPSSSTPWNSLSIRRVRRVAPSPIAGRAKVAVVHPLLYRDKEFITGIE